MTGAPIRILLVEDDEDDYILVDDLLSDSNRVQFSLDWAPTYEVGLQAIRRDEYDVYLVDHYLGAHSGLDLLREATSTGCRAPIIILTGLDDGDLDMASMAAGAADYLSKASIDTLSLERSILYAIENRRMVEALRASEARYRRAAEELARSNAELDRFASFISHDLQEPLRMVSSYLQLIEQSCAGQFDQDVQQFMAYALEGAERMQVMIQALLAYSRVSSRGQDLVPVACEVVLQHVLQDLHFAIMESGAQVSHEPLPCVVADEVQLGQLFMNLIGNALKFRGSAVPRIHISARPCQDEEAWCFAVRDNGIGLEPARAQDIFQIFRRLHTRAEYPGTGMGLAICKRIVERHGGRIWVESQPGEGSTFYFTIANQKHTEYTGEWS